MGCQTFGIKEAIAHAVDSAVLNGPIAQLPVSSASVKALPLVTAGLPSMSHFFFSFRSGRRHRSPISKDAQDLPEENLELEKDTA